MANTTELYNEWLEKAVKDPDLKTELENVKGKDEEINDRFYRDLEFGTGGLRGVIGAGTNRMNVYTVGKATQGLANYLKNCLLYTSSCQEQGGLSCRDSSVSYSESRCIFPSGCRSFRKGRGSLRQQA